MIRRIEVTGAGSVRLAAWDYAAESKQDGFQRGSQDSQDSQDQDVPGGGLAGEGLADVGVPGAAERAGVTPPAGSARPGVLLLHGLMGRASHWAGTARRLAPRYRAIALDQRGHGRSDKPEGPYSREAYLADAEAAVEQLGLAPVALVGHSMGGLTAWQLAARRPDLVRSVVVCDMRAAALGEASQREWEAWFRSWPLPFASLADVRKWFGEDDPWADPPRPTRGEFYTEIMEERGDGWRPVFARRHMLRSRVPWIMDAHWEELTQVQCPTLVVRGLEGELGRAEAQEMVRVLPRGSYAEIPDAGHLVPWERPTAWYETVERFLDEAVIPRQRTGNG